MKITFIAQSGFIIETKAGNISIDLWLKNPKNSKSIEEIPKLDYIFVTHDHADHGLKDAIELTKRDNAYFISNYDIQKWANTEHDIEIKSPGNIGGAYPVGDIEVIQVHAEHSSDIGTPVGFIIKVENKLIYHMGDTGYFAGLKDIGDMYDIDVLIVPIGSRYTMGPKEAAYAVKAVKPEIAIPMHYNTFDKIAQNPNEFKALVEELGIETTVEVLDLNESLEVEFKICKCVYLL